MTTRVLFKYLFAVVIVIVVLVLFIVGTNNDHRSNVLGVVPAPLVQEEDSSSGRVVRTSAVVNGNYYSKNANCSWVSDGELSWVSRGGDLVRYVVNGGGGGEENKHVVIKAGQFVGRPWKVRFSGGGDDSSSSDNVPYVLVGFEPRRIFRSTILARYAVHDSKTGKLLAHLRVTPPQSSSSSDEQQQQQQESQSQSFQTALWNNDNNTVLVVHKNDLYAIQLLRDDGAIAAGGGFTTTKVKRITSDGSETVTNGVADWVYEEEIFSTSSTTIYPSKSGSRIAYIKFNDSEIQQASYNLYGDYSQQPYFDPYYQYPKFGTVRYPKSGNPNPRVSIHVFKLSDEYCWSHQQTQQCSWDIELNDLMSKLLGQQQQQQQNPDEYRYLIGAVKWKDDKTMVLQVLNRIQNSSWLLGCDVDARDCHVVKYWNQSGGWIDVNQIFTYGNELLTLMSVSGSDGFEYNHVAGVSDNSRVRFVTRGSWSVDEIVGVFGDVLIIKAPLLKIQQLSSLLVKTQDPTQTHYYALNLSSSASTNLLNNNNPLKCLTCYNDCSYNTAKFSPDASFYVNTCEHESSVLHVDLVKLNKQDLSTTVVMKLEDNSELDKVLSGLTLPEVSYFSYDYKLGGKVYKMNCKVVGPKGWRDGGRHGKLPVLVDVYGGPTSQKVTKRFTPNDWSFALASNPTTPVIYLIIDGIGSGRQSLSQSFELYRDLGDKEIYDKIWVLQKFLQQHSNVLDSSRTMIWGWSYGGYLSAMVMGKDTERVFKCGVSVAPVVNWNYYDTIYTERYMSTPSDNPIGYNTSNVLQYLDNFRGKQYLVIHGNADDNVHYQQSMVLARGLEQKGILFRMQSYPDENHSLGGVRPHLFATLEDFVLNQCFRKD